MIKRFLNYLARPHRYPCIILFGVHNHYVGPFPSVHHAARFRQQHQAFIKSPFSFHILDTPDSFAAICKADVLPFTPALPNENG